jgi:hypothetical protein
MKIAILQYIGKNNKGYIFQDENVHVFSFYKCRRELIRDFKLDNNDSINQWYRVSYFKVKSFSKYDLIDPDLIISNIELVPDMT